MKKLLLLALMLYFNALQQGIHAQQALKACVVSGTVTDSIGALVPHATVFLSGKTKHTLTTSEAGEYCVDIEPGIYSVWADAPAIGFDRTYRSDVQVEKGGNQTLNFTLNAKLLLVPGLRLNTLEVPDHPPRDHINVLYEPMDLGPRGFVNGMMGFVSKCETSHFVDYKGLTMPASHGDYVLQPAFSHNFFTIMADEFRVYRKTKEIWATGNITIETGSGTISRHSGTVKVNFKNGKPIVEK